MIIFKNIKNALIQNFYLKDEYLSILIWNQKKITMRNYIKYKRLAVVFLLLALLGCTSLETELTDSIAIESSSGGFVGDPTELLKSAYSGLGIFAGYEGVFALEEVTSDEYIIPTRSTDWGDGGFWRALHGHAWDASHPQILTAWNNLNSNVYICNQVLASNPGKLQEAEARTLRAIYMYYVMDLFGQVPFRDVNQGVNENPKVISRAESFQFILDDLVSALPDLPNGGPDADPYTLNKAAVNTLLAKLYLNKAVYLAEDPAGTLSFSADDMNKVISYCDAVIASGYSFTSSYFDNFEKETAVNELILTTSNWWSGIRIWPQLHNSQGGWNGACTIKSFYDKFEPADQRIGYVPAAGLGRGFLIGPQYGADGLALKNRMGDPLSFTAEVQLSGNTDYAGIRVLKYSPTNPGDLIIFRYPEVTLMKAEAILRGGNPTDNKTAQLLVDDLRTIRGASKITVSLDVILDERGRELYWDGYRRIDQIRYGTFTNETWEGKSSTDGYRALFPIPQTAFDSNPNFTQNPGY